MIIHDRTRLIDDLVLKNPTEMMGFFNMSFSLYDGRHPVLDTGSSAIKSLIAKDSFYRADARQLDPGSRPG